ncbi:hypothetical protein LNP17_09785 [Klebsiella variicola subsp. variicola]|nr:hypothetical protein [Klebsiella variicola subsp. variicola]
MDRDQGGGNRPALSFYLSEQKAGPVYITNFQLQKVDYAHLGTDEFTVN